MASEMSVFARFAAFCLKEFAPGSASALCPAWQWPGRGRAVPRLPRPRAPFLRAATAPRRPAPWPPRPRAPFPRRTPPDARALPTGRGRAGQGRQAGVTRLSSQSQWSCWLLVSAWPLAQGRQAVAAPWRSRLTGVVFSGRC